MNRHLLTVLLLVAAIALYGLGLALPATVLIVLGMILEGAFWLRLFRPRSRPTR